jgi:predicted amidophosphoribosyltransferase
MPLAVTTFCAYRTRRNGPWTDRDHAASKFIKALKEQPVSGWAYVPVGKEHVRLDAANALSVPHIFARQAAYGMEWDELRALMLVPIPDSGCTVEATYPPKTIKMTAALLRCIEWVDAIVADRLRCGEAMTPAHIALESRDPRDLYRRLRLRGRLPADRHVVLIDDVIAGGSHLRAAAAFLESQGEAIVKALCGSS